MAKSPLDIEVSGAGPPASENQKQQQKPPSFLRRWGPALAAIAGAMAVNAALLGPTGSGIPTLTDQQIQARGLREERTASVLDMEWDHAADLKRGLGNMRG